VREQVMEVVRASFRPEFLNRIDEILAVPSADARSNERHRRHPAEAPERLLADRKITITLDERARNWLADKGYDPVLRRAAAEAGDPARAAESARWPHPRRPDQRRRQRARERQSSASSSTARMAAAAA